MTKTLVFLRGFPLMNLLIIRWKLTVDGKGQVFVVVVFFYFKLFCQRSVSVWNSIYRSSLGFFPLSEPFKVPQKIETRKLCKWCPHLQKTIFAVYFIISFLPNLVPNCRQPKWCAHHRTTCQLSVIQIIITQ